MSMGIVEVNVVNWKAEVLDSGRLVLVEFWHAQCPHCRVLEPVFRELSREYAGGLKFAKFDLLESRENQLLAARYGVMGTPTLMFFCAGRPIQDIVGALSKDFLERAIGIAVGKHRECVERSTPVSLSYVV
jgi:thioredoxin 1